MNINMNNWCKDIINSKESLGMPLVTFPGLKKINKTLYKVVTDSNIQYECIKATAEMYPSIANFTIMDLTIEAEAFGCPVKLYDMDTPTVTDSIIKNQDDINKLKEPRITDGRIPVFLKAAELCTKRLDKPTFGVLNGPFTLASRLFDMTELLMATMSNPDIVYTLSKKCTDFLIKLSLAFKEAGTNGILIAEPAAGLIPPKHCDEYSSHYIKEIVDAVQDNNFIVILHNCGNATSQVESMINTKSKCLHFGNAVDMKDIMPQIPDNIIGSGNIDPAGLIKNSTPDKVEEATFNLLNDMKSYNNFLISTGCEVPVGAPDENIKAFYNAINKYNNNS